MRKYMLIGDFFIEGFFDFIYTILTQVT